MVYRILRYMMWIRSGVVSVVLAVLLLTAAVSAAAAEDAAGAPCPSHCRCNWYRGKRNVHCTDGRLTALPVGMNSRTLVLDVSNSRLSRLDKQAFVKAGVPHLQEVVAANASVHFVHRRAFSGLLGLVAVDLSNNLIDKLYDDTFVGNQGLRRIVLSGNRLSSLARLKWPSLPALQQLRLARCQLTSLIADAFERLPGLKLLDLSGNRLVTLQLDVLQSLAALQTLLLRDNPWRCDCHLRLFRDWLIDRSLYLEQASCAEPERLLAKRWNQVTSEQFACRPQIQVATPTVVARPGQNVTLRCQISGNPPPTANWVQAGRVLGNNTQLARGGRRQHLSVHVAGTVHRWINLTVAAVSQRDVGHYLCIGYNAGGVVERNVSLVLAAGTHVAGGGGGVVRRPRVSAALLAGLLAAAGALLLLLLLVTCVCCCCCGHKQRPPPPPVAGSPRRDVRRQEMPVKEKSDGVATLQLQHAPGSVSCTLPLLDDSGSDAGLEYSRAPLPCRADDGLHCSSLCNPTGTCSTPVSQAAVMRRFSLPGGKHHFPDLLHVDSLHGYATPRTAALPRPGYVTLPRRPRRPSWGGGTSTQQTNDTCCEPVYDSLGPRTTADGSSRLSLNEPVSPQQISDTAGTAMLLPPPPPEFSTLPRNIRLSASSRPRSLSTDIIEPLHELPDEVDEPPMVKPLPPPKPVVGRKQPPPVPPKPVAHTVSNATVEDGTEI